MFFDKKVSKIYWRKLIKKREIWQVDFGELQMFVKGGEWWLVNCPVLIASKTFCQRFRNKSTDHHPLNSKIFLKISFRWPKSACNQQKPERINLKRNFTMKNSTKQLGNRNETRKLICNGTFSGSSCHRSSLSN